MPAFVKDSKAQGSSGPYIVQGGILTVASYATGGYTPVASEAGISKVARVRPIGDFASGHEAVWSSGTSKIQAYRPRGVYTESWPDVKGGKFANQVASGSAATNGAAIIALVTATTAAKATILAQPNALNAEVAGRNLVISLQSTAGGTLPADCGTATAVGTARDGTALMEAISLAALNGVVLAAGGIVYIVALKGFATLTSLTLSVNITTSVADAQVSVGPGTIFVLRGIITAESDILSLRKDNASVAAATYIGTPSQVDLGADCADNVDAIASYLSQRVEAAASENLGTLECEYVGD